jgi:hypothetical protein
MMLNIELGRNTQNPFSQASSSTLLPAGESNVEICKTQSSHSMALHTSYLFGQKEKAVSYKGGEKTY